MMNHTTDRVNFETTTCGRCGGSGHYSYNQIHGTVCYGCAGRKRVFSKRGKQARAAFHAKRMELCGAMVADLQPGQRFLTDAGKWATVVSVECDPNGSRWLDSSIDQWIPFTMVTTKNGVRGFSYGSERVIVSNPAMWPELVAFAHTLPGAIVTPVETLHEQAS